MRNMGLIILCIYASAVAYGQGHDFDFGSITESDLTATSYDKDLSAAAIVLHEFGEAYFDSDGQHHLIFEHHIVIKILKEEGLDHGNYAIPLRKYVGAAEVLKSWEAVSYKVHGGEVVKK